LIYLNLILEIISIEMNNEHLVEGITSHSVSSTILKFQNGLILLQVK